MKDSPSVQASKKGRKKEDGSRHRREQKFVSLCPAQLEEVFELGRSLECKIGKRAAPIKPRRGVQAMCFHLPKSWWCLDWQTSKLSWPWCIIIFFHLFILYLLTNHFCEHARTNPSSCNIIIFRKYPLRSIKFSVQSVEERSWCVWQCFKIICAAFIQIWGQIFRLDIILQTISTRPSTDYS